VEDFRKSQQMLSLPYLVALILIGDLRHTIYEHLLPIYPSLNPLDYFLKK
jgi:hypothetical protein